MDPVITIHTVELVQDVPGAVRCTGTVGVGDDATEHSWVVAGPEPTDPVARGAFLRAPLLAQLAAKK